MRVIYGLIMTLLVHSVLAQTPSKDLQQHFAHYRSYEATFSQKVLDDKGKLMQEGQGTMRLKKPGMMFWETRKPTSQIMIVRDNTQWLYDKDLEQVIKRKLSQQQLMLIRILTGSNALSSSEYTVIRTQSGFKVMPRESNAPFASCEIVLKNNLLTQIRLQDALGQKTVFAFSNIHWNQPMQSHWFTLHVPDGVDVINE